LSFADFVQFAALEYSVTRISAILSHRGSSHKGIATMLADFRYLQITTHSLPVGAVCSPMVLYGASFRQLIWKLNPGNKSVGSATTGQQIYSKKG